MPHSKWQGHSKMLGQGLTTETSIPIFSRSHESFLQEPVGRWE